MTIEASDSVQRMILDVEPDTQGVLIRQSGGVRLKYDRIDAQLNPNEVVISYVFGGNVVARQTIPGTLMPGMTLTMSGLRGEVSLILSNQ